MEKVWSSERGEGKACQNRPSHSAERQPSAFERLKQFRMFLDLRMSDYELVIIGKKSANVDQPAGDECHDGRHQCEDVIVNGQAHCHEHRGRGGWQGMSRIDEPMDPKVAPRRWWNVAHGALWRSNGEDVGSGHITERPVGVQVAFATSCDGVCYFFSVSI